MLSYQAGSLRLASMILSCVGLMSVGFGGACILPAADTTTYTNESNTNTLMVLFIILKFTSEMS